MLKGSRPIAFFLAVLSVFSLLAGCNNSIRGTDTTLSTGEILSPEVIESIIEAQTPDTTERYPIETDENSDIIVYWLAGGSVWHASASCSSISGADPAKVKSGSVYDAVADGKDRACKTCSPDVVIEITTEPRTETIEPDTETDAPKYPKEYDSGGDLVVYWLENGSVWHESRECPTVKNAPAVKGDVRTAYYSGKTRPCKTCSQDSAVVIEDITTTEVTTLPETVAPEIKYPKTYDANGALIVFWTESGSVWHESNRCPSVVKAENVRSSDLTTAYYAKKTRPCKTCSSDSTVVIDDITTEEITTLPETTMPPETTKAPETTLPEIKYPKDYDPNGNLIVYWTENGSVWHESNRCPSVVKAENVRSSDLTTAYYAKKTRPCKTCSSDSTVVIDDITTEEATTLPETTVPPETTKAPETTLPEIKYPKDYDPSGNLIVYWKEGGSVWHESRLCGTLKRADNVKSGDVYTAYYAGKPRPCKTCSADSDVNIVIPETTFETTPAETTADKYPLEYDRNGNLIVYWIEGGTVWHVSKYCSSLAHTDDRLIMRGTEFHAIIAGKERACKRCSG